MGFGEGEAEVVALPQLACKRSSQNGLLLASMRVVKVWGVGWLASGQCGTQASCVLCTPSMPGATTTKARKGLKKEEGCQPAACSDVRQLEAWR